VRKPVIGLLGDPFKGAGFLEQVAGARHQVDQVRRPQAGGGFRQVRFMGSPGPQAAGRRPAAMNTE